MTESAIRTLAEAVEVYYEELKAFVLRRTSSPALAADILQETWLRAALAKPGARVVNQRAYLHRVAEHVAMDHLRRNVAESWRQANDAVLTDIVDSAPNPEQVATARQELDILHEAVRDLPPKCRAVFLLYRGRGLPARKIAERLGISEKTVEKHIAKAMMHCRRRLKEAGRAF
ncbi:MAG TPA: sigma-70 family RNA polymerase sigma factor [Stellaceae bacterium]|nr:sigma-70 family RNA polymerase sigma factor [Stellaceae bacterium]